MTRSALPEGPVAVLLLMMLFAPGAKAEPATLKAAYGRMFDVGAAIPPPPEPDLTAEEKKLLCDNFTNVTPENCLKPLAVEPALGQFNFETADAFVDFAQKHGLKINGHCLVYNQQAPDWMFMDGGKPASREVVLKRLRNHIATVMSRYKGRIYSWDVVNEATSDGPELLKQDNWSKALGEDYVIEAFKAAAQADPGAKLYYNDYRLEEPAKRAKVLRLIADLRKRHIRVDGIGMQAHWAVDEVPYQGIEEAIEVFQKLGLQVGISELDLDMVPPRAGVTADPYPHGLPPELQQKEANQYARLFALFRKHAGEINRVTFWGLDDGRSWENYWGWKRTNYPLLWDRSLRPKPALAAVLAEAGK